MDKTTKIKCFLHLCHVQIDFYVSYFWLPTVKQTASFLLKELINIQVMYMFTVSSKQ